MGQAEFERRGKPDERGPTIQSAQTRYNGDQRKLD